MNKELFERLLYEDETSTLDFKEKQYRFSGATEEEKSELLKDILGFANAWRRSEAYILIGVKDFRGGRSEVIGLPTDGHLDGHSLQQFVNNLTNQPIRFHYEAFGFEGKQVGIIRIDEQTRPIYLKRDYGKLTKKEVYVRRGSSTDPTKPASPEEIAQMGVGSGQPPLELLVEFAHAERNDELGPNISLDAEFCKMPARETIPDLPRPRQQYASRIKLPDIQAALNHPNDDFFRELADFVFAYRLFQPIRLVVRNSGEAAANNVRTELMVPTDSDVWVVDSSEIPAPPERSTNALSHPVPVPKGIKFPFRRDPGKVCISKNDDQIQIEIDFGDLQPGRRVWSEVFYIAKARSGEISLRGLLFADNLPRPKNVSLSVSISVTETQMTVAELCSLAVQDGGNASNC
jgi:schlafen family protein